MCSLISPVEKELTWRKIIKNIQLLRVSPCWTDAQTILGGQEPFSGIPFFLLRTLLYLNILQHCLTCVFLMYYSLIRSHLSRSDDYLEILYVFNLNMTIFDPQILLISKVWASMCQRYGIFPPAWNYIYKSTCLNKDSAFQTHDCIVSQ